MSRKNKQPAARKASKKIALRVLRTQDRATVDSGKIRFGSGSAPASLRK